MMKKSENPSPADGCRSGRVMRHLFGVAVVLLMFCMVIIPVAAGSGAFSITSIEEGDVLIPGTGVIVRWSASDGADGYKISMRDLTTDTVLFSNYDRGTKRSYSLSASDLTPGHDYRIAVCAYSSSGDAWFERCFSVGDAPAINAVYATPESGNAGSTFSFTVWANEFTYNVGIEIDGYLIGTSDEYLYIKGQNVFVIEHLVTSPGNNRVVTAYAYSYDGSEKLTEGTAQTEITVLESPPAGVPTISSPLENSIHGIGEDLKVTWKAPSTSPDSYTVYLYHGSDILYHTSVSSTSVTIPGEYITSYGSYSIDVYSVKSGYSKDIPGNVFINVESPNLPAGVPVLSSPSATGTYYVNEDLTVSWTAPSTNPDSYCIWLYGGGMSGGVLFDDIDETSFTIPGDKLANAGSYSVYVYAEKDGYVKDNPGNVLFTVSEKPSSAQDLVNHMLSLKGMTGEDLGYTDAWCAWFIGDSAAAVGLEDIIPKYAKTGPCITGIMKAGGTVVCFPYPGSNTVFKEDRVQEVLTFKDTVPTLLQESERLSFKPKVGDVIGVLWDDGIGDHTISHVEVVYAVEGSIIHTVSGNAGNKVGVKKFDWNTGRRVLPSSSKLDNGTIVAYARPNYAAVTEESLPTLTKPTITVPSADIDIYPGQELKVSWTTSGTSPTKYIVQVFREGDFVGSFETSGKTITIPSSCLNILGEYSIDIYPVRDGYDSNVWSSVYFSVVSPVGDFTINSPSLDASLPAGSDVTVSWSKASSATGYLLSLRDLTTDDIAGGFNRTDVGNVLSYPIGVLTAGHEYRVAVGAYSQLSDYVHWSTTTFSVSTASAPSVTPSISLKYADNYYVRSDAKIEGDAVREQALSAVMARYQGVVDTSKPVIYFIDGYGSSLKSTSLSTAMCVVVIDGEIVFVSTNSATLPDQPYHPVTNDGTDLPTVVDGTYSVTNTLHRDYPALHVTTPPVVRIHVADECTDKGKCGSTTSAGINIHKPSSTSIVSETKDWANSAGCLLVGMHDSGENIYYGGEKRFQASNKEYDRFASVLGFSKSTYSENGISYGKTKLGDLGKKTVCSVVIDRQYGYKNNAEFKSYLDTKYKNNNEVISKIIGSEYDYSVNVPENKPVEEKPLIFAVSTVLDEADLTDDTPIVIFWDVSDGALGYTFSMRDLTLDKKWIDNVDTNGKCTYTLSVEMLVAGHEYRVAVCAYNDAGETWVEYAFSIPEDESEIIPSSFIISDVSSPISVDQPLEITWTESIGATGYRFTLMDISESNVIENTTVGNELRYIIQAGKLAYGHDYCVAVSAYNDAGETWAEMEFSISPEACVLSFDANGGSGSMSPITGSSGKSYVLPECTFTAPAGKEFKAWIIGSDEYTPSSYYTPTSSVTIKALWVDSISTPEVTGTPDTSWYDAGSSYFVISTADELAGLAVLVNGGESFKYKTISLDSDIDLSKYTCWTPIGINYNSKFSGKFLGNNHQISNLMVSLPDSDAVGLFGKTDGDISGICLLDSTIIGKSYVGGIIGDGYDATIHDCIVLDSTINGYDDVGGIVGDGSGSTITTCIVNSCDISANGEYACSVGGIAGNSYSLGFFSMCSVSDCVITANSDDYYFVGGIVGFLQYSSSIDNCAVSNCTIIGEDKYASVGGITGAIYDSSVSNSLVVGCNINGIKNSGGIAGWTWGSVSNCLSLVPEFSSTSSNIYRISADSSADFRFINNYAWVDAVSSSGQEFTEDIGVYNMNGESIYTSQIWNNQAFFEDTLKWDFENTWKMNTGNDKYQLPVLQFQQTPVAGDASYLTSGSEIPEPTTAAEELAAILDADVSGNVVTITKDVTTTQSITINLDDGEEIVLTTSGNYTIYRGVSDEPVFEIYSGTLTLKGKDSENQLTIDGRKDVFTENQGSLIDVKKNGIFNLCEYAVLTNNGGDWAPCVDVDGEYPIHDSDGVVIKILHGYFNMYGGSICNNDGDGVSSKGIITIAGGEICNNAGHAITSYGGDIIMTGGSICHNGERAVNLGSGSTTIGERPSHEYYGKLSISGDAVIPASEEVFVPENSTIKVIGYLSEGAGIYNINIQINKEYGVIVDATEVKISGEDLLSHFVLNENGYTLKADGYTLVLSSSTYNPTPTPDKPASPTLTEPESLPADAKIKTNTVAETNAATKAEVGYQVKPTDIAEMKAPTITRGSLSVMLNDAVKVMKKLSDGSEVEVEATVNEDGSVSITGSLDGAESVTVNFIGRQFGDTLGNGKVGAVSALKIAQNIVGLDSGKMSDTDKFYGDVNGDGNVKVVDALMIAQYTVGILDENYVRVA